MKRYNNFKGGVSMHRIIQTCVSLLFILLILFTPSLVYAYGNNSVGAELRADLAEVYNARLYGLTLKATSIPTTGLDSSFTTGWLSVYVSNGLFPDGFTQVGLITFKNGLRWFAYSEEGIKRFPALPERVDGQAGKSLSCCSKQICNRQWPFWQHTNSHLAAVFRL